MKWKSITAFLLALSLVSCRLHMPPLTGTDTVSLQDGDKTLEPIPVTSLHLELADPHWDGKQIPNDQKCRKFGGDHPSTPRLLVGNIPEGSDAIVLEFSDRDYGPMNNGGHGKIGFLIPGDGSEVEIPSVPGHTYDLPAGFFLIQEHQAPSFDDAGAYMPPCSGGLGHSYYVTVKAVELITPETKEFNVLDQSNLELGKY